MSIHDDLLEQAKTLATLETRRPKQASLRRAVSAAYYALFHLLTGEGATLVAPTKLRTGVKRAFSHGDMKSVCVEFAKGGITNTSSPTARLISRPLDAEIQRIAAAFVDLQQLRHSADYDMATPFNRINVLQKIALVESAFADWRAVRRRSNSSVFLASLLFERHWKR